VPQQGHTTRPRTTRTGQRGNSLLEVMIAATVLLLASLGLAHAFTSAGIAGKRSEREEVARRSLESIADELCTAPWSQLLSWHGAVRDFGDHTVVVEAHATSPRLILVECAAIDDATQQVLARVATFRAES
jgi:hypothetical protein